MRNNADVVFRDLDHSPALVYTINRKLEKLSRFAPDIMRSRIVLDSPHKRRNKGKLIRASIELNLPGRPITVSHDATNAHIAIRDAFYAAERCLKDSRNLSLVR